MADAGNESVVTTISYCPHLDVYHYTKVGGEEYFFDTAQLEHAIDTHLKNGDARQADFMATLTGLARRCPHCLVEFNAEGRPTFRELVAKKMDDEAVKLGDGGAAASGGNESGGSG